MELVGGYGMKYVGNLSIVLLGVVVQAEDGRRVAQESRGLVDVYKRQLLDLCRERKY